MSKVTKRYVRIHPKKVEEALRDQVVVAAAHLDLEGVVYLKLTRTGAQECFVSDATSEVLKKSGFMYKDQAEAFWKKPAMEKWSE